MKLRSFILFYSYQPCEMMISEIHWLVPNVWKATLPRAKGHLLAWPSTYRKGPWWGISVLLHNFSNNHSRLESKGSLQICTVGSTGQNFTSGKQLKMSLGHSGHWKHAISLGWTGGFIERVGSRIYTSFFSALPVFISSRGPPGTVITFAFPSLESSRRYAEHTLFELLLYSIATAWRDASLSVHLFF